MEDQNGLMQDFKLFCDNILRGFFLKTHISDSTRVYNMEVLFEGGFTMLDY